ncbi:MAG: hypothetical protein A2293_03605 [Elusimicrobia bacterium RIFOXYB2_FULL_49_7]|nr:MAG: hypothetical protein A2293_03605 [Elusimicrobia bacterium RIFOXYB2_FULL_49_7]
MNLLLLIFQSLLWPYLFFVLVIAIAMILLTINRSDRTDISEEGESRLPFVSIVLPARNEEQSLRATLQTLIQQDYPKERIEIIVVNDRSTDKTSQIAFEFSKNYPQVRLLTIESPNPHLAGKQNALHTGILSAQGEYILITDADCALSDKFTRLYASKLKEGHEVVFARTGIKTSRTFFELLQKLDISFLFGIAAVLQKLGYPSSAMGNNIGFSKQRYLELGGYPAWKYSLVEDYQLVNAFRRSGAKSSFMNLYPPIVLTESVKKVSSFFHQRQRWASAVTQGNPIVALLACSALLLNSSWVLLFFTYPATAFKWLLIKLLADLMLFSVILIRFREPKNIAGFPLWWAYFQVSPLLIFLLWLAQPIKWKT